MAVECICIESSSSSSSSHEHEKTTGSESDLIDKIVAASVAGGGYVAASGHNPVKDTQVVDLCSSSDDTAVAPAASSAVDGAASGTERRERRSTANSISSFFQQTGEKASAIARLLNCSSSSTKRGSPHEDRPPTMVIRSETNAKNVKAKKSKMEEEALKLLPTFAHAPPIATKFPKLRSKLKKRTSNISGNQPAPRRYDDTDDNNGIRPNVTNNSAPSVANLFDYLSDDVGIPSGPTVPSASAPSAGNSVVNLSDDDNDEEEKAEIGDEDEYSVESNDERKRPAKTSQRRTSNPNPHEYIGRSQSLGGVLLELSTSDDSSVDVEVVAEVVKAAAAAKVEVDVDQQLFAMLAEEVAAAPISSGDAAVIAEGVQAAALATVEVDVDQQVAIAAEIEERRAAASSKMKGLVKDALSCFSRPSTAANLLPKKPKRGGNAAAEQAEIDQLEEYTNFVLTGVINEMNTVDGCVGGEDDDDNGDEDDDDNGDDDGTDAVPGVAPANGLPDPVEGDLRGYYDTCCKELDAANQYCKDNEKEGRDDLITSLKEAFHPDKIQRGEIYTIAQGKCGVPARRGKVNFEGRTAPDDDDVFYGNSSINGARAIGNALPPNGVGDRQEFTYLNGRLRLIGVNCRAGCKTATNDKGTEYCCNPDKVEVDVTVKICKAILKYLTSCGCFVLYLNLGGWAVKSLMSRVRRELTTELTTELRRNVLIVGLSTHMYRLHYSIFDPTKQATSVSKHMRNMSDMINGFMIHVNRIREVNRLDPIPVEASLFDQLVNDDTVPYVVCDENLASVTNHQTKVREQAVGRGIQVAQTMKEKLGDVEAYQQWLSDRFKMGGKMTVDIHRAKLGSNAMSIIGAKGGAKAVEAHKAKLGSNAMSIIGAKGREKRDDNLRMQNIDPSVMQSVWATKGWEKFDERVKNAGGDPQQERSKKGKKMEAAKKMLHGENFSKKHSDDVRKGELTKYKKGIVKEQGAIYRFKCSTCNKDTYVCGRGNMWEKVNQKWNRTQTCMGGCRGKKGPALPRFNSRKTTNWTFMGELNENEKKELQDEFRNDIVEVEDEKKTVQKACKARWRAKKKGEKSQAKKKQGNNGKKREQE